MTVSTKSKSNFYDFNHFAKYHFVCFNPQIRKKMNIKGKIVAIFETQQVTSSFQKREFVLEYLENPQYPEFLKFEMIQDKCALIDQYSIGQEVDVHFNLKGRKWTDPKGVDKYFNTLQAWRITEPQAQQPSSQPAADKPNSPDTPPGWLDQDEDDTPF